MSDNESNEETNSSNQQDEKTDVGNSEFNDPKTGLPSPPSTDLDQIKKGFRETSTNSPNTKRVVKRPQVEGMKSGKSKPLEDPPNSGSVKHDITGPEIKKEIPPQTQGFDKSQGENANKASNPKENNEKPVDETNKSKSKGDTSSSAKGVEGLADGGGIKGIKGVEGLAGGAQGIKGAGGVVGGSKGLNSIKGLGGANSGKLGSAMNAAQTAQNSDSATDAAKNIGKEAAKAKAEQAAMSNPYSAAALIAFKNRKVLIPIISFAVFILLFPVIALGGVVLDNASFDKQDVAIQPNTATGAAEFVSQTNYIPLYQEYGADNFVPWPYVAAIGDVLTRHGAISPYDDIERGDLSDSLYYSPGASTDLSSDRTEVALFGDDNARIIAEARLGGATNSNGINEATSDYSPTYGSGEVASNIAGLTIKPSNSLIVLGTQDYLAQTPLDTWQTNLETIEAQLQGTQCAIFVGIPENGWTNELDISPSDYNDRAKDAFGGQRVITPQEDIVGNIAINQEEAEDIFNEAQESLLECRSRYDEIAAENVEKNLTTNQDGELTGNYPIVFPNIIKENEAYGPFLIQPVLVDQIEAMSESNIDINNLPSEPSEDVRIEEDGTYYKGYNLQSANDSIELITRWMQLRAEKVTLEEFIEKLAPINQGSDEEPLFFDAEGSLITEAYLTVLIRSGYHEPLRKEIDTFWSIIMTDLPVSFEKIQTPPRITFTDTQNFGVAHDDFYSEVANAITPQIEGIGQKWIRTTISETSLHLEDLPTVTANLGEQDIEGAIILIDKDGFITELNSRVIEAEEEFLTSLGSTEEEPIEISDDDKERIRNEVLEQIKNDTYSTIAEATNNLPNIRIVYGIDKDLYPEMAEQFDEIAKAYPNVRIFDFFESDEADVSAASQATQIASLFLRVSPAESELSPSSACQNALHPAIDIDAESFAITRNTEEAEDDYVERVETIWLASTSARVVGGADCNGSPTDPRWVKYTADRLEDIANTALTLLATSREQAVGEQVPVTSRTVTVDQFLTQVTALAHRYVFYSELTTSGSGSIEGLVAAGIPREIAESYVRASEGIRDTIPDCDIPPEHLAGHGHVESGHARGSVVNSDGTLSPPILGPVLDGSGVGGNTTPIFDTDNGIYDGDMTYDRAVGFMQFIPQTWEAFKLDGNNDQKFDPNNIWDLSLTAANYLCSSLPPGGSFQNEANAETAAFAYNRSSSYVQAVMEERRRIEGITSSFVGGSLNLNTVIDYTAPVETVWIRTDYGASTEVNTQIAGNVQAMYEAAAADGIFLYGWGYRPTSRQIELRVINGCPDIYTSPASTCRVPTARPGASMHEKGLAIDLYRLRDGERVSFIRSSAEWQWMFRNAARFGFKNLPSESWHWSTNGR